jgi:hypothetical protein
MAAWDAQEQNLSHFFSERHGPPAGGDSRVFNLSKGNASLHQASVSQVSQSVGREVPIDEQFAARDHDDMEPHAVFPPVE